MLERELESAAELALGAGRILMEIYATDFGVELKGESDPVTEADKRSNAYIVEELRSRFPDDGIVAEENEDHGSALSRDRIWYVDPLDGTKEFIKKNGEFAVMIGLAIEGSAQLGVVYQPELDKLYRGVVGQGASLTRGGQQSELRVSQAGDPTDLKLVVSRYHRTRSSCVLYT